MDTISLDAISCVVTFSGQGERCVHQHYGLFGGAPGRTGRLAILHDDGRVQKLANKPASLEVSPDAVVLFETPGAGGYGKPSKRAAYKRTEDAAGGKFSAKFMRNHYGAPNRKQRRR